MASLQVIGGTLLDALSDFDSNDEVDIEAEALKVELDHNFVVYLDDMEFGDPF